MKSPTISVKLYNSKLLNRSHFGASTIKVANSAKTPKGANCIMRSIILRITSFKESKILLKDKLFFQGLKSLKFQKLSKK